MLMTNRLRTWRWAWLISGIAAALTVSLVCIYMVWMGYLAIFASEGALPPRWRLPDTPSDAEIISDGTQCASGGCWREFRVQPAPGQSPSDLADEMGVSDPQHLSWHPLDPYPVTIESLPNKEALVVRISYYR